MHREQMHQPLCEAHEKHLIVDRALSLGLLLRATGVVQEYQIEIRAVAKFHAAELAVADDAKPHRPTSALLGAHRRAELRRELLPGEREHTLDDQLGDIGQAVADPHHRQLGEQVGYA
jgi:hypothetical protein